MDDATISAVVNEITPLIVGRRPGKILQLTPYSLGIDFGLRGHGYLFVSVEPAQPRMYLIKRRVRDLEKHAIHSGQFALSLRKDLSNTTVSFVEKDPMDRIVRLEFNGSDEIGERKRRTL